MDSSLSNVFRYFRILHPCLKFSAELSNRYLNLNGYREENSSRQDMFLSIISILHTYEV